MEEKKYPYLGVRKVLDAEYVVMFLKKNYGVIVMSEVEDIKELSFGEVGAFDESVFQLLEKDRCVRLSN